VIEIIIQKNKIYLPKKRKEVFHILQKIKRNFGMNEFENKQFLRNIILKRYGFNIIISKLKKIELSRVLDDNLKEYINSVGISFEFIFHENDIEYFFCIK